MFTYERKDGLKVSLWRIDPSTFQCAVDISVPEWGSSQGTMSRIDAVRTIRRHVNLSIREAAEALEYGKNVTVTEVRSI